MAKAKKPETPISEKDMEKFEDSLDKIFGKRKSPKIALTPEEFDRKTREEVAEINRLSAEAQKELKAKIPEMKRKRKAIMEREKKKKNDEKKDGDKKG